MMAAAETSSHDRILRGALELFSTKGYDATSVREICEAAAITKPTLYHFYGSKEGVYRALVGGALDGFRAAVAGALGATGSVRDRLRGLILASFAAARREPGVSRFVLGLIHHPPSSAPSTDFVRFYEGILSLVSQTVEDAVGRGELAPGPTDIRLLVLMGSLMEALHGYLLAGRPDLTPELADALVDTILRGWTAPPVAP
jgi:TetR/AcrR family transcriptional regulator